MIDKEGLQERAQLVRVYEASCRIDYPTEEELRFRHAVHRKLATVFELKTVNNIKLGVPLRPPVQERKAA